MVQDIFRLLIAEPRMPADRMAPHGRRARDADAAARIAADYIAGMTDRFALDEHHRLFDTYATTP